MNAKSLSRITIICLLVSVPLYDAVAQTQRNCKPRDQLIALLSNKYKESRRAYGLQNRRQVLELYASEKGTWTAVVTTPDGRSCIVAAGEGWTEESSEAPGVDA